MKNKRYEQLLKLQRQYHQTNQWRLSSGALFIPHSYTEMRQDGLSWWDDVGFILNGRRVIVWWQHPRHLYVNAIEEQAWVEAGPSPKDDWLFEGAQKNYRKVGASRKKIISYTSRESSDAQNKYYESLRSIRDGLMLTGIDAEIELSSKIERLSWAMGLSLVAPVEVRNETEIAELATIARRIMLRQTTLDAEFGKYGYGRSDWLQEQVLRNPPDSLLSHAVI